MGLIFKDRDCSCSFTGDQVCVLGQLGPLCDCGPYPGSFHVFTIPWSFSCHLLEVMGLPVYLWAFLVIVPCDQAHSSSILNSRFLLNMMTDCNPPRYGVWQNKFLSHHQPVLYLTGSSKYIQGSWELWLCLVNRTVIIFWPGLSGSLLKRGSCFLCPQGGTDAAGALRNLLLKLHCLSAPPPSQLPCHPYSDFWHTSTHLGMDSVLPYPIS